MTAQILPYQKLSLDDFHNIIQLRIAVFVVEQNCPYQDLDGKDKKAFHLMLKNDEGKLVGTARILPAGVSYNEVSIGRVASHPDHRKEQLGHAIMTVSMQFIQDLWPGSDVRISAQSHLCAYYAKHGFVKTGKEYLEDDIPHSEMLFVFNKS
ncbi:MAG: GNAT family N-acetyltransferase [Crocinitomicaceae bacterium]|nr:GNAT family N-acetyltransferase [Crocinitomicaceae bacterium]